MQKKLIILPLVTTYLSAVRVMTAVTQYFVAAGAWACSGCPLGTYSNSTGPSRCPICRVCTICVLECARSHYDDAASNSVVTVLNQASPQPNGLKENHSDHSADKSRCTIACYKRVAL